MLNATSRRRFTFVGGGSNKFWEVIIIDNDVTVCFGRTGTNGQSTTKSFPDAAAANKHAEKLVKEKIAMSPDSVATFIYAWGERREFQVRKDHEFSLKPEEQIKYKLVDVQPPKAVIVNTQKPDAPIEIGPLPP